MCAGLTGLAVGARGRLDPRRVAACMTFPEILLEDDLLVAFDKPGGLPVVSDRRGRAEASLMDLVHDRFGGQVANVHRLDAEASGVVLCAKTKAALDFLSGQF